MSSSTRGDSAPPTPAAKKPASTFAVTCNLLSRFLKEQKGAAFADLGLGISTDAVKMETSRTPPTTMNLLPGVDVSTEEGGETSFPTETQDEFPNRNANQALFASAPAPSVATAAAGVGELEKKQQLTIFYGGKVLVFDNFPADKAVDLVQIASRGSGAVTTGFAVDHRIPSVSKSVPVAVDQPANPEQASSLDTPQVRKASLLRFLEKRKARIIAEAPYKLDGVRRQRACSGFVRLCTE